MAQNWTLHPILETADEPAPGVWYVVAGEGHPSARTGHSCIAVNGQIYVFGGANPEGPFDGLHSLELARLEWVKAEAPDPPSARYEHAAVAVPGTAKMLVFGGADAASNLNDLYTYDTASHAWANQATTGEAPSARTVRVAGVVGALVYVFGGGQQGQQAVDDTELHVLDTNEWCWTTPEVHGPRPTARQGHSLCTAGSKIVVFGGMSTAGIFDDLWLLDSTTKEWTEFEPSGDKPRARTGHAAAVVGGAMYVFGGLSLSAAGAPEALDDFWRLDMATMEWTKPKLETAPINARLGHTMCAVKYRQQPSPQPKAAAVAQADAAEGGAATAAADDAGTKAASEQPAASAITSAGVGDGEGLILQDVTPLFSDAMPSPEKRAAGTAATLLPEEPPDTLVVFGGMDLAGGMFDDCLLIRPC